MIIGKVFKYGGMWAVVSHFEGTNIYIRLQNPNTDHYLEKIKFVDYYTHCEKNIWKRNYYKVCEKLSTDLLGIIGMTMFVVIFWLSLMTIL